MPSFLRNQLSASEIILILAGILFFASTLYVARGGDLSLNYLAKGLYFLGTILFIFKKF